MFRLYKGTRLPPLVHDSAIDALESFEFRDNDVLLATYPKSGTHWMNEVIQLILHDGDPTRLGLAHRRAPLEIRDTRDISKSDAVTPAIVTVAADPSPRVLLTHCRPQHFSEHTWTKGIPIVYLMRNPKDMFLSMFEFYSSFVMPDGSPYITRDDFDKTLLAFIDGEVPFDGWCQHVISFEELERRNENILIVTYEDMKKDIASVVRRVAEHIKHDVTDDIVAKVVEQTSMEAMRRNYGKAMEEKEENDPSVTLYAYLKKGVAGRYKEEYPEEKWKPLHDRFKKETKDTIYAKQYFQ